MFVISVILTSTVSNILNDTFFMNKDRFLYELSITFLITVYLMLAYYGIFRAYVYSALLIIIATNIISIRCGSWSCKAVLFYPVIFTVSAMILAPIVYLIGLFYNAITNKKWSSLICSLQKTIFIAKCHDIIIPNLLPMFIYCIFDFINPLKALWSLHPMHLRCKR